jgi:hypothetical protein
MAAHARCRAVRCCSRVWGACLSAGRLSEDVCVVCCVRPEAVTVRPVQTLMELVHACCDHAVWQLQAASARVYRTRLSWVGCAALLWILDSSDIAGIAIYWLATLIGGKVWGVCIAASGRALPLLVLYCIAVMCSYGSFHMCMW